MTQTRCRGLQQIPGGHSRATCRTVHEAYISHGTHRLHQASGEGPHCLLLGARAQVELCRRQAPTPLC